MKIKHGFCCYRSCKDVFQSEVEYLLHLDYKGFCRGRADRVVRDLARIIRSSCQQCIDARIILVSHH
jgi:hypothetical protein